MLARADSDDLPLKTLTVDLSLMLNTITEQFESLAAEKHISIESAIAPNLKLQGDEDQLIQVVSNLVDNAVKYSPRNSTITITAKKIEDYMEFAVEDEGKGVPVEERNKIFQKFYRSHKTVKGFGMGLAIARGIVESHNGKIWVETGKIGSRFVFELPID